MLFVYTAAASRRLLGPSTLCCTGGPRHRHNHQQPGLYPLAPADLQLHLQV